MVYWKRSNKRWHLTLRGKEAATGYLFLIPFLIGLFCIFLPMTAQSIQFSISNMEVTNSGFTLHRADKGGFEHYIRALTIDPAYNRLLLSSILEMVTSVPVIIIFSFFAANLLNQKFPGRTIARSIFFFPVLLSSGVILGLEANDLLLGNTEAVAETATMSEWVSISAVLLQYTNLPVPVISFLLNAINGIYDIIIASGVQILIFLAGLQSISPSLYEASEIEGATAWESFWKITFPMISPLILVNSVYTIIDSFTRSTNEMMTEIQDTIFNDILYGYGSAMAWIYFVCIVIILGIAGFLISRKVFYYDER